MNCSTILLTALLSAFILIPQSQGQQIAQGWVMDGAKDQIRVNDNWVFESAPRHGGGPAAPSDAFIVPGRLKEQSVSALEANTIPAYFTRSEIVGDQVIWHYSNGGTILESKTDYRARTGKSVDLCCSTGYCTHHSGYPKVPVGGCTCGCNAAECNCPHTPNVSASVVSAIRTTGTGAGSLVRHSSPAALPPTYTPSTYTNPLLQGMNLYPSTTLNCPGGNCYQQPMMSVGRGGALRNLFTPFR